LSARRRALLERRQGVVLALVLGEGPLVGFDRAPVVASQVHRPRQRLEQLAALLLGESGLESAPRAVRVATLERVPALAIRVSTAALTGSCKPSRGGLLESVG
jgi:hypothetical protein